MAGNHTLHRDRHHLGWDNTTPPALEIAPGDVVTLEVADASGGQLGPGATADDVPRLDFARVNPVTGPIAVHGARPGDALAIDILDFGLGDFGWTAIIPGFGLLADDFAAPYLHISRYDAEHVAFTPDIRVPTRPFPGTIGVAPAAPGLHSVVPPRAVGGNMDLRDVVRGATLYLPVQVPGALLSVGDTHAAQGDGEVCGTAVETAMTVTVRVRLIERAGAGQAGPGQARIARPQLDLPAAAVAPPDPAGYRVTTGVAPDLMTAARDAVRDMIDYLGREHGLAPELAYCLCSVAVSLRISEVVDVPNWLVSAYLPRSIFI